MDFVDYYKILGIDKSAGPAEVKTAYRKKARKSHPDLNPNDPDAKRKFQQINEANEVLSDPEKRKKYDQYGQDWQHAAEFEQAGQSNRGSRNSKYSEAASGMDFSEFFESMFGGQTRETRTGHRKYRGEDFNGELHLTLQDAYKTHKQTLTINNQQIRITIPAGVENGQTIKIAGYGGPGRNGGPNGDLYLTFSVDNQGKIKRVGDDLFTTVDLDLYTAVLGGDIFLELLSGKVKLKVKPETQNGSKVRLTGKGFPVYKKESSFGDLFLTYSVKIPKKLTDREKALFRELAELNVGKM